MSPGNNLGARFGKRRDRETPKISLIRSPSLPMKQLTNMKSYPVMKTTLRMRKTTNKRRTPNGCKMK